MSKTFEETLASIDSTLLLILAALRAGTPAATGTATLAASVASAGTPAADTPADSAKPDAGTEGKPVRAKTTYHRLADNGGVLKVGSNAVPPAGSTEITKAEYEKTLTDEADAKKASLASSSAQPNQGTSAASSTATDTPSGSPSEPTFAEVQAALTKLGQTPETGRALLLELFKKWEIARFPELANKVPPIPNAQLLADIQSAGKPAAEPAQDDPMAGLGL